MENKTKKSPLAVSLLLLAAAATFAVPAADLATLASAPQIISTNASVASEVRENNQSMPQTSKDDDSNNSVTLADQPFLVEHGRTVGVNPINETHIAISLLGNGTITLPNSTEVIRTKDTGNAIARLTATGNIVHGQIRISIQDGIENATVSFTEIGQNQRGVGVAYFTTNSTGKLASLDNMVAVIQDEIQPNGDTLIRAWEWRGGYGYGLYQGMSR